MPRKKTHEKFCQEVKELTGDDYIVMTEYVLTATKLTMKHNVENCNHEFLIRPADFLKGSRCPNCYRSKTTNKQKSVVK